MSDPGFGGSGRKTWHKPDVSRRELTAEELRRIEESGNPDLELRRIWMEREHGGNE